MAYSPPNTFAPATTLTAADIEGNNEALRVYLHGAIPAGDFAADSWIQTRHIQPPVYSPFEGLQHGVSGHQGGQWSGGTTVRLTFLSKYLTGGGVDQNRVWQRVANTSFSVQLRHPAFCLFHYWYEVEVGPDRSDNAGQDPTAERQIWVGPYVGLNPIQDTLMPLSLQQEAGNNLGTLRTDPVGAALPYTVASGYAQRDGTMLIEGTGPNATLPTGVGEFTIGLCGYSTVDRAAIVNWSVCLETFYI